MRNVSAILESSLANISFIGVNGFYYLPNMQVFEADRAMLSIEELQQACKADWSDLISADPVTPYLATACFNGLYINSLLSRYGFLPGFGDFKVKNMMAGVLPSWGPMARMYIMLLVAARSVQVS